MFGMLKRWFAGIVCVSQGQTHYDKNEFSYARVQFERALRIAPDHYVARAMLGSTLRIEKKYDQAIAELTKAIELKPEIDKAWRIRGITKIDMNDSAGAIEDCHKALELKKDIKNYIALGAAYTAAGRYEDAEQAFANGTRIQTGNAILNERLGDCYLAQGKIKEAQSAYKASIKAYSKDELTYAKLASVEERLGNYKEALTLYTRASFLKPENAEYKCDCARVAIADGDKSGAIFSYQEAVKLDPDCLVALAALCRQALEVRDIEKAQAYADRMLAGHADNWEANYLMSLVCEAQNNKDEANKYLKLAAKYDAAALAEEQAKN